MASTTQISAHVSVSTKEKMERYVRENGVTRGHLIEQALLHYLKALEELPLEAIVPARIVLSRKSAEKVRDMTSHPPEPTEAMKKLLDER
jgi:hypothetical protein